MTYRQVEFGRGGRDRSNRARICLRSPAHQKGGTGLGFEGQDMAPRVDTSVLKALMHSHQASLNSLAEATGQPVGRRMGSPTR
jgi:hypothetical protein